MMQGGLHRIPEYAFCPADKEILERIMDFNRKLT